MIMKKMMKRIVCYAMTPLILCSGMTFQSCTEEEVADIVNYLLSELVTGWLFDDEHLEDIPQDIVVVDVDEETLADAVSLESKYPPIGDQGQYGTCVAWAAGYAMKTALDGIDKGWTSTQLSSPAYQTSPADLWAGVTSKSNKKGCDGTSFETALTALISTGAASLQDVPYTSLDCKNVRSPKGAANAKLANYRKIADSDAKQGMTLENFKFYLDEGRPVVIGAKLGDRFMSWNSSAIISYDTYLQKGMQHAYHAMVLSGYDNERQAFRVRNSWGTSWGDNGSIWVDYNFFLKSFCFAAFVAQNENSVSASAGAIAQADLTSGYDLLAYSATDWDDDDSDDMDNPNSRYFTYSVYNSGEKAVVASQRWSVVYMYYNAFDANDYQIIYHDYYTDEFGEPGDNDEYEDNTALAGAWWNNTNTAAGQMVGYEEYGDEGFQIHYSMPESVDGKYYLVVIADAYGVIAEGNEDNNFYFITAEDGKPLTFVKGVMQDVLENNFKSGKAKRPAKYADTPNQTPVCKGNENAYTPGEISAMLLADKKNGRLEKKLAHYQLYKACNPRAVKMARRVNKTEK